LQFNPSFESAGTVAELARAGSFHPDMADIFPGYALYRHQVEAIRLGTAGKDFIVTSGTGSGKSLTYIGSIFHHLLCHPETPGIIAIVVYPMNALINSQFEEFSRYKENYENASGRPFPISFGQYTGQERETVRQKMRGSPPQILLTNYMMLELLLTRVRERAMRDAIYEHLRFLVFDELHTYRGRQGADVAMLIRRIRSRCSHDVLCIGTSATMVSAGNLAAQREQVAQVATTLFGRPFTPAQVVPEQLTRSLSFSGVIPTGAELAAAIQRGINPNDHADTLQAHPMAIWLENRVALEERDGHLVRRKPQRISDIVAALAQESGVADDVCRQFLADLLQWISAVNQRLQDAGHR
jgi:Lhr-like helicase